MPAGDRWTHIYDPHQHHSRAPTPEHSPSELAWECVSLGTAGQELAKGNTAEDKKPGPFKEPGTRSSAAQGPGSAAAAETVVGTAGERECVDTTLEYILGVKFDAVVMVMALIWGDFKLMN